MANPQHLAILKHGGEVWNRWRKEHPGVQPDLSGADLSEAYLGRVNLRRTNLRETTLHQANLEQADLNEAFVSRANLNRANLSKANLKKADFIGASLIEATFQGADLSWANLSWAHLFKTDLRETILHRTTLRGAIFSETIFYETDLSEAIMFATRFGGIDFSTVKGLDTVKHEGPSYIDILTLTRSKGRISELFLRGAGVPDIFITYIASLTGQAIQYYSCFISYSSQDETFAQRLHADLQQKGVRCWFASENMKIGDKIRPTIDQSIRLHDKLLVILSENSMQSDWVEDEVETALDEEKKRQATVLFPIRLDETVMDTDQAWAAQLRRSRHIGDFSNWKYHDAYQKAFKRLLRDLKAEG